MYIYIHTIYIINYCRVIIYYSDCEVNFKYDIVCFIKNMVMLYSKVLFVNMWVNTN